MADGTQVTAESSFTPSADSIPSSFGIPDISGLHPTAFAAGAGAASGGTGVAGSFIVNVITETTTAYINNNVLLNTLTGTATYPSANSDEGVTVSASDTMTITDWAGGVGGGLNVGVGAALDVNIVTEDTQAYISNHGNRRRVPERGGGVGHERNLQLGHARRRGWASQWASPARPRSRNCRSRRARSSTTIRRSTPRAACSSRRTISRR